jgi:hypothetical protein
MVARIAGSQLFDHIICTASSRGQPVGPSLLHAHAFRAGARRVTVSACLRCALEYAFSQEQEEVWVIGSLLLAADFDRSLHRLGLSDHAVPLGEVDPEQTWMRPLC